MLHLKIFKTFFENTKIRTFLVIFFLAFLVEYRRYRKSTDLHLFRSREHDPRSSRLLRLAHEENGEGETSKGFGERRPRYQGPQTQTFSAARRTQREEISSRGAPEVYTIFATIVVGLYCCTGIYALRSRSIFGFIGFSISNN
jgi:hypothetical protein